MEKLEGYKFKLKKGTYILFRKREINFDTFLKSYIGIVRDYDGVNSKSGVLSKKAYIHYHLSGEIIEVDRHHVFAWYKDGFILLQDMETKKFNGRLDDFVDLYKMDKKEITEFKGRITKNKILKNLK